MVDGGAPSELAVRLMVYGVKQCHVERNDSDGGSRECETQ